MASSSLRSSADTSPPRASMASDAPSYSSAIVLGMSRPSRISKTDATIESISGLEVTRIFVSGSGRTCSKRKGSNRSALASPSRCASALSCCASVSGARRIRWKLAKRRSSMPAGREVHSITWPCGASTSMTWRSMESRLAPPSSRPSTSSKARRASIACRSMAYTSGRPVCSRRRCASSQFQLFAKAFGELRSRICSRCTLITIGTKSVSSRASITA
eukprot:3087582-Prymnesium_polylepis.2